MREVAMVRTRWVYSEGDGADRFTWFLQSERLNMKLVLRPIAWGEASELWVWLAFECCGTDIYSWESCADPDQHPVRPDSLILASPGAPRDEEAQAYLTALPMWVEHCRPDLGPLHAHIVASDLDAWLREQDWTGDQHG